jgi:hypothetical protein
LIIEAFPVFVGDLKIVALVRAEIEPGDVAGKAEVFFLAAGADRRIGLRVKVAPVFAVGDGIGAGDQIAAAGDE